MKQKAYENSRVKHQLLEKKRKGVKEVIWSLKPSQRQFVENCLGFETEEYLYEVKTRSFYNIRELDNLLKTIHFSNKRGKKYMVIKLNDKQKKTLDSFNVSYRPIKYRILLC